MIAAGAMTRLAANSGKVGMVFDFCRLGKSSLPSEGRRVAGETSCVGRLSLGLEGLHRMAMGTRFPRCELRLVTRLAGIGADMLGRRRKNVTARASAA